MLVPSGTLPSMKVTMPLAAAGVTVAVKVTALPNTEGFNEEVSVVWEAALLTTWTTADDALPESLVSPL